MTNYLRILNKKRLMLNVFKTGLLSVITLTSYMLLCFIYEDFFKWFFNLNVAKMILAGCIVGSFAWMFSQLLNLLIFELFDLWQLSKKVAKMITITGLSFLTVMSTVSIISMAVSNEWSLPIHTFLAFFLLSELTVYPLYKLFLQTK